MEFEQMPDEALIENVSKTGCMQSFKTLYERYKTPIFAFLTRLLGDRTAAEDCAHDVFIHLHEKAGMYRQTGKFSTWLYEIARNRGLDLIRKRKIRRASSLDAAPPGMTDAEGTTLGDMISGTEQTDSEAIRHEKAEILEKSLARLEPGDRELILLCDVQELSHEEVGKIIGCRAQTVAVKLHRAHKRLAGIIGLKENVLD